MKDIKLTFTTKAQLLEEFERKYKENEKPLDNIPPSKWFDAKEIFKEYALRQMVHDERVENWVRFMKQGKRFVEGGPIFYRA